VPVEAALRHAEMLSQRLDADAIDAFTGQQNEARADPVLWPDPLVPSSLGSFRRGLGWSLHAKHHTVAY